MAIQIGDTFPSVTLKRMGAGGLEEFNTGEELKGKKVILFGVPGAFTPACAQKHLPGYVANADAIKSKGVDAIICIAVNDPFVMNAWFDSAKAHGKVMMWPDGNGAVAKELDITFDGAGAGLATRLKRFVMTLENGVVKDLAVENAPGEVELSGAEVCLTKLAA